MQMLADPSQNKLKIGIGIAEWQISWKEDGKKLSEILREIYIKYLHFNQRFCLF